MKYYFLSEIRKMISWDGGQGRVFRVREDGEV